jgi:hypothetical protein
VADWVKILDEQIAAGEDAAREVPAILDNPAVSEAQVKALFSELEKQADFVEKLRKALEKFDHDFPVIEAAEKLEERYCELAASAAEKLQTMRG